MLHKYKITQEVALNSSISKAAEKLHLSQPAVSHAINDLEKKWEMAIFQRLQTGMRLTKNGEYLLRYINRILVLEEQLNQEVKLIKGLKQGKVRVGTFPSVTTKWIPKIINIMNKIHPNIEVEIIEENYETIQKLILSGELDCGFISETPLYNSLHFTPLYKDHFYCIINKCRLLAKNKRIPINSLSEYPFIIPGKGGAVELGNFFKKHDIKPNIRYEIMDINQSIVAMIESDLGISILPHLLINGLPSNVVAKKLDVDFHRIIGLTHLNNPSPATKFFIEQCNLFIDEFKLKHEQ